MKSATDGIHQELEQVLDILNLYYRTGEKDRQKLQTVVRVLRNIADTIAVSGQTDLQHSLNSCCKKIEVYLSGETLILEDAVLSELTDALPLITSAPDVLSKHVYDSSTEGIVNPSLTRSGIHDVMMAVMKEAAVNMDSAKDAMSVFAENPGQQWDQLSVVNGLLQQVAGSLKIVSHHRASNSAAFLCQYIDQLLAAQPQIPSDGRISLLTNAVSSINYYLEAIIQNLPDRHEALLLVESSLNSLAAENANDTSSKFSQIPNMIGDEREVGQLISVSGSEDTSLPRVTASTEEISGQQRDQKNQRLQSQVENETIDVHSNLLDRLVNLASELSGFYSCLERHNSSFRSSLRELVQVVDRLKEQLCCMEAEVQTLLRHKREGGTKQGKNCGFSIMDRYAQLYQLSESLVKNVSDLKGFQDLFGSLAQDSGGLWIQQGRIMTELQHQLMKARVVPFVSAIASRMRRAIRQACQQLHKRAELKLVAADDEISLCMLDRIVVPLEHMLRNSVIHGIEIPEVRVKQGKPEVGVITVSMDREGGKIVIRIVDDGAGLDTEAIRARSESRGLIAKNTDMADDDLVQLIFSPGFSMAKPARQIAGSGMGMDVIHDEIRQLGGTLHVKSTCGRGVSITICLPFTLEASQALIVGAGRGLYAIPLSSIEGVSRINGDDAQSLLSTDDSRYDYGGEAYQIEVLGSVLGQTEGIEVQDEADRPGLILTRFGGCRIAFYVDKVIGCNEIMARSLGAQVSVVQGITGGAILDDGRVVLILNIPLLGHIVTAGYGSG